MSDTTYEALQQAIRDHVADESDAPVLVMDWLVCAAGTSYDSGDATKYTHAWSDSPAHTLRGLTELCRDEARGWCES